MPVNRREFLTTAGVAAGALVIAPRARAADGPYFDIHTHLGQEWGQRPALMAAMLLEWMDKHNIAEAAVLPLINPESWDHPLTTDYVLKETTAHRDRLVPFCSIDPRTVNLGTYEAKRDLLARYRDAGARGFGEHKAGLAMDDARNIELFRACAEVGLPVLFHLDTVRNTDAPGLPGLERVLRQIPDGVFIGHAQGFWANISGDVTAAEMQGYPKSPVAPGGALDRLFSAYPNLYGDLSAGSGANAIARDKEFGRAFMVRNADRLLFGTDYLQPEQDVPQFDLFASLNLPEEVRGKIYRANAQRVLGLTVVARASNP